MNSKMKSWTVSWLSLKTKVEPGLRGSRVMSGDWRRLHRVHGVSNGSAENHWVSWLIHKAKTEEPKTEDTRTDRMACVEAKQGAVAGHPSDGENLKTSKTALEGLVSLVIK
jgi:hypothetical protein